MGRGHDHVRTRRGFLNGAAGVGAGIAAGSFADILGTGVARAGGLPGHDAPAILDLAATAETLAIAFYQAALDGAAFHIGEKARTQLKVAMDVERGHLRTVHSLGGTALQQRFYLPDRLLQDASVFVDTGLKLETALAGAYLAATRQFAELGQPALAATSAALGASEAQHLTLLGHLAGLSLDDLTLSTPSFRRASEALPVLAPFLSGGSGFFGPVSIPAGR